jgi:lipopolysaccharide transport system ATP-binding protein
MYNSEAAVIVEGLGKRYYTPQRNMRKHSRILSHLRNIGILKGSEEEDYFWALRDVSFEVPRGQILGILGQNGSGKSTLLKILTGVTPPTMGRVVLKGRVGSLLEVGTGFHPDMSGRENVFMSGTLLGIPKAEIKSKFDEMVDFAGIEEFLDVPVKRYSSGMYVRLAYAVASMLRSDILLLDEVLAVGDMGFQEKARKNMKDLVTAGRTILLVSHYAQNLNQLCNQGIILNHGKMTQSGEIRHITTLYRRQFLNFEYISDEISAQADLENLPRQEHAYKKILRRVELVDEYGLPCAVFKTGRPFGVRLHYANAGMQSLVCWILIYNENSERVATITSAHTGQDMKFPKAGIVQCTVADLRLGEGVYVLGVSLGSSHGSSFNGDDVLALRFAVRLDGYLSGFGVNSFQGAVHKSQWRILE